MSEETIELTFEWTEEGNGWVGRVRDTEGWCSYGSALQVYPEGGLHGRWVWKAFDAKGTAEDPDTATYFAEAHAVSMYEFVWGELK